MTRATLAAAMLVAIVTAGCQSATEPPPCVEPEMVSLDTLALAIEASDGTPGVDLDGWDSEATDELGCRQEDGTDPDGSSVDAQSPGLVPTFEYFTGVAPLVATSGTLSMSPAFVESECSGASFALNDGAPQLAEWNGQTLRARGLGDLPLSLEYAGVVQDTTLREVAVRATVEEGRLATLHLAGALEVEALVPLLSVIAAEGVTDEDIRVTLEAVADLEPDAAGECRSISFVFEAER